MEDVRMEVKVDSTLIRSKRENLGWTQDHLATVTGLSLRTIQRIEKTGSASLESVTALASVLAVEVADLRANAPPRARAIRLSLELPTRLALAAISGALCALVFRWGFDGLDYLRWSHFAIAGALFGVAVLCPYLRPGRGLVMRACALIAASASSYFCAVMTVLNAESWFPGTPFFASFLLGSLIGVAIVLVAARILIPLRVTAAFWLLGLAASLVGGVAMYAGFELLGDTTLSTVASFSVWHVLACIAIHRGHQPNATQDGLLAAFARTRGRFSIVPGWMRLSHSALVQCE
jgi:transcriptional regulator with XRE-family HTH domain